MPPLGSNWEQDFEREWNRLFQADQRLPNMPSRAPTSYPFKLEDVVREAMADLRKELGKGWLPNSIFGTRLHAALRHRLEKVTSPGGWWIAVEQPFGATGMLPPELLSLTVRQYLDGAGGHLEWLRPQLSRQLNSKIGDIKPDLMMRGPDGVTTLWDLTSREHREHVAKTILYANLISRDNHLTRIGETYWLKFG
jgi:hypothetical protein